LNEYLEQHRKKSGEALKEEPQTHRKETVEARSEQASMKSEEDFEQDFHTLRNEMIQEDALQGPEILSHSESPPNTNHSASCDYDENITADWPTELVMDDVEGWGKPSSVSSRLPRLFLERICRNWNVSI
jgi:hypothetical protein